MHKASGTRGRGQDKLPEESPGTQGRAPGNTRRS